MNHEEFDRVVEEQCDMSVNVLGNKAREYSTSDDRFHNFNVAARVQGITPEKALVGMMMKHWVSTMDMIEQDFSQLSMEAIHEKFGDLINYILLLKGMTIDRKNMAQTVKPSSGVVEWTTQESKPE